MEIISTLKVLVTRMIFKALSWGPKMIFEKWLYSDTELKDHIVLLPRADGVQIQQNYLSMYLNVINLSPYLDIKIEMLKVRLDHIDLNDEYNIAVIKKTSIYIGLLVRKQLTIDEKKYLLEKSLRREYIRVNIQSKISSGNRNFDKNPEVSITMVRCLDATS